MAIDHSLTYKKLTIKNVPHILRKNSLTKLMKNIPKNPGSYADFGCSNGFLTEIFRRILDAETSFGFDHSDNLEVAKARYPDIQFDFIDLNKKNELGKVFDVLTCFETLEHVGCTNNALKTLKDHTDNNSIILISVPIEIGFIGVIKFLCKRYIFKYELALECSDIAYFITLLKGSDISQFRIKKEIYGSHFGFDYRNIDTQVREIFHGMNIKMWNSFSTRFYKISLN